MLALFVSLGGVGIAAGVAKNSVTSKSVKDGKLLGKDVKDDSLTGADIAESTRSAASPVHVARKGLRGRRDRRAPRTAPPAGT